MPLQQHTLIAGAVSTAGAGCLVQQETMTLFHFPYSPIRDF